MNKLSFSKGLVFLTAALFLVGGFFVSARNAFAANPLLCFADAPGTCLISSEVATLNNTGGGDSGVYTAVSSLTGKTLTEVGTDQLSFTYTGTPTTGSPRISLPIDTDGNGTTDENMSISANNCNDGSDVVNVITDPTCTIFLNSNGTTPVGANWAAVLLAHPTWKVSNDNIPFIIADEPGTWTVSNVQLGSEVVAPVPMAISSVLPTFTAGIEAPFTVSTVANDDAGKMVLAHFTIPDGASVTYLAPDENYYPLTDVYGPADTGFPVGNITSDFKAIFTTAGTYTVTVDFKLLDGTLVATKDITATVVAAPVPPTKPTTKEECKNDGWKNNPVFKNQGDCESSFVSNRGGNGGGGGSSGGHHQNVSGIFGNNGVGGQVLGASTSNLDSLSSSEMRDLRIRLISLMTELVRLLGIMKNRV